MLHDLQVCSTPAVKGAPGMGRLVNCGARLRPVGVVPHQLTRVRGLRSSPPSPAMLEARAP